MCSEPPAVRVSHVSKRFELYATPRDRLKQFVLPRMRRAAGLPARQYFREFWALRDVSLAVRKGESWGIVGANGSGKSTLLQTIAGTLAPTLGEVAIEGRVTALLELGAGFNPEFTGRENVYLNGAVLGFSRREVAERMDAIVAFADIGDHFDRPLSTYSTGMQMRVAFAVATSFEPDILVIDEALAVGDAYFQQKCFHRLETFKARGGTLLFVSHDANAVKELCDKAVLLDRGTVVGQGAPRDVIDLYQGMVAQRSDMGARAVVVAQGPKGHGVWKKVTTVTTNHDAELVDFHLLDAAGRQVSQLESERPLTVKYVVRLRKDFDRPAFGLIVRDRLGRSIFETSTYAMSMAQTPIAADAEVEVRFAFDCNLAPGQYSFSVGVANRGYGRGEFEEYSLLMHDVEQLQVLESPAAIFYGGVFNMRPAVSVEVLEHSHA